MSKQREKLQDAYSKNIAQLWKETPIVLLMPLFVWWEELSGANNGKGPVFTKTQTWQYIAVGLLALLMTPLVLIYSFTVNPIALLATFIIDTVVFAFHYVTAKDAPVVSKINSQPTQSDPQNTSTARDAHQSSPSAARSAPSSKTFAEHCISKYDLVDASDESLAKALRMAANSNEVRDIKYLLSMKSYLINWQGPETGKTALHLAVAKGHAKAIEALGELGAARDIADKKGETVETMLLIQRAGTAVINNSWEESLAKAFRKAAANNWYGDLRLLSTTMSSVLKKPELMDAQDSNPQMGKTAFHWAVEKGNQESIAVLKELGAKTDIRDIKLNKTVDELLIEQANVVQQPTAAPAM